MGKRKPSLDDHQLTFSFAVPRAAVEQSDLAGIERVIASGVSTALKDDPRTRWELAAAVSQLLDDEVSKLMLDAYSSEARDGHNISASRFFALIAATGRFDILNAVCAMIGCKVLVGEEIHTAELGHLDREIAKLNERKKLLARIAKPIERGGSRR